MRALLQRVSEASVTVDGETLSEIGAGLVVFVCAEKGDGEAGVETFARKIANMRLFADADGKTNLSILDRQPVHPGRRMAQGKPPRFFRRRRPGNGATIVRILLPTAGRRRGGGEDG